MIRRILLALVVLAASAGAVAAVLDGMALQPDARLRGGAEVGLTILVLFLLPAALLQTVPGLNPRARRSHLHRARLSEGNRVAGGLVILLINAGAGLTLLVRAPGFLLLPLIYTGFRALRRPRPEREFKTVRDAFLVAFASLVITGSPASLAAAVAVTLLAAGILPGIHASRTGRTATVPVPLAAVTATALLAASLFLLVPRFEGKAGEEPSAAANGPRPARREGRGPGPGDASFTAVPRRSVSIGDIGRLQQDFRPILEVTVLWKGKPSDAEEFGPLFRSGALESFDGTTWESLDRNAVLRTDAMDGAADGFVAVGRTTLPKGEAVEQRLRFLTGRADSLFCLGMATAVGGEGARGGILLLPGGEVRTPEAYPDGATFTIRSVAAAGEYPRVDGETPSAARRRTLLAIPPGHDRVEALARMELAGAGTGTRLLRRLESLLQHRCAFSLDIAPAGAAAPVEAFLFNSRRGHCELFASAAALLLRAEGVPARIVIGFRGGVFDRFAKRYTLRGADAHAWVEAWFPGEGWLSFDPTPSAGRPLAREAADEDPRSAAADGRSLLERVLGYDAGSQKRFLLGAAGLAADLARNTLLAPDGRPRYAAMALLLAGAGLLGGALLLRARRTLGPEDPAAIQAIPRAPQPEAWEILLERLAMGEIRPSPFETGREFAERAVASGALPAGAVIRVADASSAERWGGLSPAPEEHLRLLAAARSVEVRLAAGGVPASE